MSSITTTIIIIIIIIIIIEQQLFLKTRNGNIRSNRKEITPRAEEGYCKEATQSGPLAHSQPPSPECSGTYRGKTKKDLDKRGNKRNGMVLYVLQTRKQPYWALHTYFGKC